MKTVLAELDLSADASEESALAAVKKLKNRITTLEPFEADNTKLKNRIATFDGEQVDALLAERKITDEKVVNRLKPVLTGLKDRAERVAFLDDCFKGEKKDEKETRQTKLFNRETKPPGQSATDEAGNAKAEKVNADKVMNRARAIVAESKVSLATAVSMAQREIEAAA